MLVRKRELEYYQGREDGVEPKFPRGAYLRTSSSESSVEEVSSEDSLPWDEILQENMGDEGLVDHLAEFNNDPDFNNELSLRSAGLTPVGAFYIAKFLIRKPTVTLLDISINSIGALGASYISKALASCALTNINFNCNHIGDEGFENVVTALKGTTSLRKLTVGTNSITVKGVKHMLDSFKNNEALTCIDLEGNAIGSEGFRSLCMLVSLNVCITSLGLRSIGISDEDAKYAYKALRGNTRIVSLNLQYNSNISENGAKYLDKLAEQSCILSLDYPHKSSRVEIMFYHRSHLVTKLTHRWMQYKVGVEELSPQIIEKLHKYASAVNCALEALQFDEPNTIISNLENIYGLDTATLYSESSHTYTFKQELKEMYDEQAKYGCTFWQLHGVVKALTSLPWVLRNTDVMSVLTRYLGSTGIEPHEDPVNVVTAQLAKRAAERVAFEQLCGASMYNTDLSIFSSGLQQQGGPYSGNHF